MKTKLTGAQLFVLRTLTNGGVLLTPAANRTRAYMLVQPNKVDSTWIRHTTIEPLLDVWIESPNGESVCVRAGLLHVLEWSGTRPFKLGLTDAGRKAVTS